LRTVYGLLYEKVNYNRVNDYRVLNLDRDLGFAVANRDHGLVFVNKDLLESLDDLGLSRLPNRKHLLILRNNGLRDSGRDLHQALNLITGDLENVFGRHAFGLWQTEFDGEELGDLLILDGGDAMGLCAFGPGKVGADRGQNTGKQTDHAEADGGCLGAAENGLGTTGKKSVYCAQNDHGKGDPVRIGGKMAFAFGVEPGKASASFGFFGYQVF